MICPLDQRQNTQQGEAIKVIETSNWGFPTTVWFGLNRIQDLAKAIIDLGFKNPLIVTDAGLARLDMIADLMANLAQANIHHNLFAEIKPNPTGANVEAGVLVARDAAHDSVIAIGGGSALDAGKAIAFMAGQTRPIWDFEDIGENWKAADTDRILPVIAIPTTAGTGSEFGRASVITQESPHRKVIVFHSEMLPKLVIMDPVLTVSLPAHLTATTGMDALSHALESYCAPGYHPMADGLALQAMTMVKRSLVSVTKDGADLDARADMLVASGMACIALQKGLGAMHALSHALGAKYDSHHGLLNAVLMPYVLRHNWPAIKDKMGELSFTLQLGGHPEAVLDWIQELQQHLDIPTTLGAMGLDIIDPNDIAEIAAKDPCAQGNPTQFDKTAALAVLATAL